MTHGCLVDTTRCIGCRTCQVSCKRAHGLKAEETKFLAGDGYQNPLRFSPHTRTYVSFHEVKDDRGRLKWVFVKRQCLHCTEMPCANSCAPEIFRRTATGEIVCNSKECIGCAACIDECPFEVPAIEYWDVATPHLRKCTFCYDRQQAPVAQVNVNGKPLSGEALRRHQQRLRTPACAAACPTGALKFGDRDKLLAEARRRIAARPNEYVDHIYGEKELGGTGWLYLAAVPFERLGFPTHFAPPPPASGADPKGMGSIDRHQRDRGGSLFRTVAAALTGICWFFKRRDDVRSSQKEE
ncbi:MAG: 4Fe-4S dicluster domain-containing protein [Candidatus Nealsonbacteria bacterium]|nr:4Fe-4S dicluster domain-containing protein [Candidatus Nealsonbacteria bacterium]